MSSTSYRNFSEAVEKTAAEWAGLALTAEKWEDLGRFGGTESQPFRVRRADGFVGLAKPGVKKADEDAHAAHEKLAADLAFHLKLPVPPCVLWDRGDDNLPSRYVVISAWAFEPALHWGQVSAQLKPDEALSARAALSALSVFEAWIGAQDRKADHLLVRLDPDTNKLQLASIDYAFSLSKYWTAPNAPIGLAPSFLPNGTDNSAVKEAVQAIETMDEGMTDELVKRIPDMFLNPLKKQAIRANLKTRRVALGGLFGI